MATGGLFSFTREEVQAIRAALSAAHAALSECADRDGDLSDMLGEAHNAFWNMGGEGYEAHEQVRATLPLLNKLLLDPPA